MWTRALAAASALFVLTALAAAGDLDSTFGAGGIVEVDFWSSDQADDVRVLADGQRRIASLSFDDANNQSYIGLARLRADGSLDPAFGSGGKLTQPLSGSMPSFVQAVRLQDDGKVLLAGVVGRRIAVGRLRADGTTDTAFGTSGVALADFGSGFAAVAADLALQPDGKIVVAGTVSANYSSNAQFALVRFTADGALDPTFSDNGLQVSMTSTAPSDHAYAVALQADGKIVAAGESSSTFALARYNTDGSPDTTFGCGGFLRDDVGLPARIQKLAVAPGGALVASGVNCTGSDCSIAVTRYLGGGARDPAFGNAGEASLAGVNFVDGMAVQPDGRVLIVSNTFATDNTPTGHVFRLGSDGVADAAFDGAVPDFANAALRSVRTDGTDGILVAGARNGTGASGRDALVARVLRGTDGSAPAAVAPTAPDCSATGGGGGGGIVVPTGYGSSGAMDEALLLAGLALALLRRRRARR